MPNVSRDEIITVLSKVTLFDGIKNNPKALQTISEIMDIKSFPKGTKLIEEGTLGDQFFIVLEGQVSIYKSTADGDTYKVVILKGDSHPALGEGGLIEAEPRSATVVTDVETKCMVLSRESFGKFSDSNPEWALPIMKRISIVLMGRLRQTSNDLMLLHKALMLEIRG